MAAAFGHVAAGAKRPRDRSAPPFGLFFVIGGLTLVPIGLLAQQVADTAFDVSVARPAYARGAGPGVLIDEAHRNFHTADGRYAPFARLLTNDGYRIARNTVPFATEALAAHQVLVIANATGGSGPEAYAASAFTDAEADAVRDWVRDGGALLLIADHAPFGVAAESLALRFGVAMSKGYTEDSVNYHSTNGGWWLIVFSRRNALLRDHLITRGRDSTERVSRIVAFTGQSLSGPPHGEPFLALSDHAFDHPSPTPAQAAATPNPAMAWATAVRDLPTTSAAGRAMAIALRYGRGRVVVLGEAAMLSAQLLRAADGQTGRMGMNVPGNDNRQLALNILHWLTGVLPEVTGR